MSRSGIGRGLQLAVSVGVLATLLSILPIGRLWESLRAVPPGIWVGAVAGFLAGHLVAALKWRLLMGSLAPAPATLWLRAHFSGLIANLCLPGVAGGDLVRAGWLMRVVPQKERVAIASVADRAIDLTALLTLAAIGALGAGQATGARERVAVVAVLVLGAGMTGCLAGVVLYRRRPGGFLGRLVDAGHLLVRQPLLLAGTLVLSLTVQATFVAINLRLGMAAGVDVGGWAWLLAWPLAKITALIPISLAGLGVREAALVSFMQPFGAPPEGVLVAGLLWEGVLVTGGVVGWLATMSLRTTAQANVLAER